MTEAKPEEPAAEEPAAEEPAAEEPTAAPAAPAETKGEEPAVAAEPPTEVAAEPPTEAAAAAEGVGPTETATGPSSLGIWAFVLALLGLVGLLPIIGSVLGFVLGRVAVRQSDSRRLRGGRGLAIAAVTISVITLAVIVLSIAAYALVVAYLEI